MPRKARVTGSLDSESFGIYGLLGKTLRLGGQDQRQYNLSNSSSTLIGDDYRYTTPYFAPLTMSITTASTPIIVVITLLCDKASMSSGYNKQWVIPIGVKHVQGSFYSSATHPFSSNLATYIVGDSSTVFSVLMNTSQNLWLSGTKVLNSPSGNGTPLISVSGNTVTYSLSKSGVVTEGGQLTTNINETNTLRMQVYTY